MRIGLVNRVAEAQELEAVTVAYARTLTANGPSSIRASKFYVDQLDPKRAERNEAPIGAMQREARNREDFRPSTRSLVVKRKWERPVCHRELVLAGGRPSWMKTEAASSGIIARSADIEGVRVVGSYFDAANRPRPPRGAVLFARCSFNSLNKWAHGIADNLALSVSAETIGRGTAVIVGQPLLDRPMARVSQISLAARGVAGVPPADEGEGIPPRSVRSVA